MGIQNADLPVETGVGAVLDVLAKTGREGNRRFFNVLVRGWENSPGMNHYDVK